MSQTGLLSISGEHAGQTVAALLRLLLPGQSWNAVRRMIAVRRVRLNRELILDPARRVKEGDTLELLAHPLPAPRRFDDLVIRHLDEHIVVVEKPSGVSSVRHPSEREWTHERKTLSPTLEDLVPKQIRHLEGKFQKGPLPRLRIVHRLDKATSGLIVFARSVIAERGLGRQFHRHTVTRRYLTVVPGLVQSQTVRSVLVRDRGDGRRGSAQTDDGKDAITHVEVVENLDGYTLLSCRLETGRTHQIRIHLAELGHPVCGEAVYNRTPGGTPTPDVSGAPRLALHATELGFLHPVTEVPMHWDMPLPDDLSEFLLRLRGERTAT